LLTSVAGAQTPAPGAGGAAGAAPPAASPPPAAAPAPNAEPPSAPTPPSTPAPAPGKDAFGEEVSLEAKTVVMVKGTSTWDAGFETLKGAFGSLKAFLDKERVTPSGPFTAVYTERDDTGFQYQAEVAIAEAPKNSPRGDISVGSSPVGKMVKFVHRGSYDAMQTTYDDIDNYLDEKSIDYGGTLIEEYVKDPLKTPEDQLVVNIYVSVNQ
jgi:effector-binding domain-containing protein